MSFLDRDWVKRFAQKEKDGTYKGLFSSKAYGEDWLSVQEVINELDKYYLIKRGKDVTDPKIAAVMDELRQGDETIVLKAKIVRSNSIGDLHVHITHDNIKFGVVELSMSQAGRIMAPIKHYTTTFGV